MSGSDSFVRWGWVLAHIRSSCQAFSHSSFCPIVPGTLTPQCSGKPSHSSTNRCWSCFD